MPKATRSRGSSRSKGGISVSKAAAETPAQTQSLGSSHLVNTSQMATAAAAVAGASPFISNCPPQTGKALRYAVPFVGASRAPMNGRINAMDRTHENQAWILSNKGLYENAGTGVAAELPSNAGRGQPDALSIARNSSSSYMTESSANAVSSPQLKSGRFSLTEKETIRSAIYSFLRAYNLSENELPNLLNRRRNKQQSGLMNSPANSSRSVQDASKSFWKEIAACLPDRSIESIYHCARRMMDDRNTGEKFTAADDELLMELVARKGRKWEAIGEEMGRLGVAIKDRYTYLEAYRSTRNTRDWTLEETHRLREYVREACRKRGFNTYSTAQEHRIPIPWNEIAARIVTKNAYQCRQKFAGRVRKLLIAEEQGFAAFTPDTSSNNTPLLQFVARDNGSVTAPLTPPLSLATTPTDLEASAIEKHGAELAAAAAAAAAAATSLPTQLNVNSYLTARPRGRKGKHVIFEWTLDHLITLCDRLLKQSAYDESDVDWTEVARGPLSAWTSTHLRSVWIRHAQHIPNLESKTFHECVFVVRYLAEATKSAGRGAINYGRSFSPQTLAAAAASSLAINNSTNTNSSNSSIASNLPSNQLDKSANPELTKS